MARPLFFFFVGAVKNRVWHISDTKVVLTHNRFWLGVNWIHVTYYSTKSRVCHSYTSRCEERLWYPKCARPYFSHPHKKEKAVWSRETRKGHGRCTFPSRITISRKVQVKLSTNIQYLMKNSSISNRIDREAIKVPYSLGL